jgi:ABC-type nitrate/sulfonate/bicarbonate transport system permease component
MTGPRKKSNAPIPLTMLSWIAVPVSWGLLYVSGRVTGSTFTESASNAMLGLLWGSAAVAVLGFILGVFAVRSGGANRIAAISCLVLNAITLLLLLILGIIWVGLSI